MSIPKCHLPISTTWSPPTYLRWTRPFSTLQKPCLSLILYLNPIFSSSFSPQNSLSSRSRSLLSSLYFLPSNNILLATISLPIFSPNLPRLIHKNGLINGINKIYFMGYFPLLIKFS